MPIVRPLLMYGRLKQSAELHLFPPGFFEFVDLQSAHVRG